VFLGIFSLIYNVLLWPHPRSQLNKSVKAFDTLKVGDSIHARFTEAVAISVEKIIEIPNNKTQIKISLIS